MAKGSNILTLILLAGGAYFGYDYLKKHNLLQAAAETRNLRVRIEGIHSDEDNVSMDINIENPNANNFDIKSFVGSMFVDGKQVGEVKMFGDYNVKANSEQVVPLQVRPNISVYRAALNSIVKGKSRITFSGTINVNNHAIPLSISYSV
jgi:LEA14-like dessication related protein